VKALVAWITETLMFSLGENHLSNLSSGARLLK